MLISASVGGAIENRMSIRRLTLRSAVSCGLVPLIVSQMFIARFADSSQFDGNTPLLIGTLSV